MNKSFHAFIIGLGVACILSGVYWLFKGEWLEGLLALIIGAVVLGSRYMGSGKKDGGANV